MVFENLTPEQKEKLKASKTPEELLALAHETGYDLSDEDLEAVSGGHLWSCNDDSPCSPYVCTDVCKAGSTFTAGVSGPNRMM